ncbi:ABC transporter permease [Desertimonas flava]|uniref:ABC transporter permease n=1 Tax=Desertimonas flava TaxID=2064846 RepID=UPI000E351109|nr:ABC transporter permease [Desertimonas flava]
MSRWKGSLRSSLAARDLLGEAAAAITRRPGRSLLTALGTTVGVAAFVATTGLAATAQSQVGEHFDELVATEVRVTDTQQPAGGAAESDAPFPADAQQRLERLAGVEHAGLYWKVDDDDLDVRTLVALSRRPRSLGVMAVSPGALLAARPDVGTGRLFDDFHDRRGERVALLGRHAAEQLGITRVDNQAAIFISDHAYVVLGIIDHVERVPELLQAVVVPSGTAIADFANEEADDTVLIEVAPGAAGLIGSQAAMAVRPQDPDRLAVVAPPEPGALRATVESDVTALLYGLAGLSLLVGMIGIANTTLVAVLERRSEIGVRRALGARRRHVAGQFLAESATLGTLGGVLGASLGILVVVVVSAQRGWTTTLDPALTLPAPVIGAVTGLLAGLQPSWRAARVAPADALRTD